MCTNGDDDIKIDKFVISVYDCTGKIKLSESASQNDIEEDYSATKNQFMSGKKFFESTDEEKCPLKFCSLFKKGCATPFTGNAIIASSSDPI